MLRGRPESSGKGRCDCGESPQGAGPPFIVSTTSLPVDLEPQPGGAAGLAAAHRTPRSARISAASTGWAVPPKTALSRHFGCPVIRLVRRQAEALPDLLLDDLRRGPRVYGVDVLLAPEDLQDGVGLVVIVPEPDRERLLGVIFPGDQLSAAYVAPVGDLRAVGDQVVVHPAVTAQPAVEDPPADLAVGQVKLDDAVDVVALQEELGLPRVPREPVDDEAEVPVVLG